jgi:hypothetical protein
MNFLKQLFSKQPSDPAPTQSPYTVPTVNDLNPACVNWVPELNKPAYVIDSKQWGIIVGVVDDEDAVQVRLANGKVVKCSNTEVACTEMDAPPELRQVTFEDSDNNTITIGCGRVDGDMLFWIDTPYETVTIHMENLDRIKQAVNGVLM